LWSFPDAKRTKQRSHPAGVYKGSAAMTLFEIGRKKGKNRRNDFRFRHLVERNTDDENETISEDLGGLRGLVDSRLHDGRFAG
jgi:hypothetical protein